MTVSLEEKYALELELENLAITKGQEYYNKTLDKILTGKRVETDLPPGLRLQYEALQALIKKIDEYLEPKPGGGRSGKLYCNTDC